MPGFFGISKKRTAHNKKPPSVLALEEAAERINKRGDVLEAKIRKLDAELLSFKEHIKKTRAGPAQDAIRARALLVLKHKRIYESQKDMIDSQRLKLEQVSPSTEGSKGRRQTVLQRTSILSWVVCR